MDKLKELLTSRKFWAAVIGLMCVTVKTWRPDFPLAEGQVTDLALVLAAYILGVGLEKS